MKRLKEKNKNKLRRKEEGVPGASSDAKGTGTESGGPSGAGQLTPTSPTSRSSVSRGTLCTPSHTSTGAAVNASGNLPSSSAGSLELAERLGGLRVSTSSAVSASIAGGEGDSAAAQGDCSPTDPARGLLNLAGAKRDFSGFSTAVAALGKVEAAELLSGLLRDPALTSGFQRRKLQKLRGGLGLATKGGEPGASELGIPSSSGGATGTSVPLASSAPPLAKQTAGPLGWGEVLGHPRRKTTQRPR